MKKYLYLIAAVLLLGVTSCKDKEQPAEKQLNEFQEGLTSTDSLKVVQLTDSCMSFLKGGQFDNAFAMLCEYDDSMHTVLPLSEATRNSYQKRFTIFPVVDYKLVYFTFCEEGLNDVKYEVTFGAGGANAPKTFYMFNPVKIDGTWHLSVKNAMQSVVEMN